MNDQYPPDGRPPEWIAAPFPWEHATVEAAPIIAEESATRSSRWRVLTAALVVAALVAGVTGVALRHTRSVRTADATPTPSTTAPVPLPSTPLPATNPPTTAAPIPPNGSSSSVAATVNPGVVDIDVATRGGSVGAGTGMVLTPDGQVLTNNHVVNGAVRITVTSVTTGRRYSATVVGTDPTADVALLQMQGASGLPTVPLGSIKDVSVGDGVVAIGNAGGVGGTPSVVTGQILAVGQELTVGDTAADEETLQNLVETNAPIVPGDSGGPLVTTGGKVIGMDTAASIMRRRNGGGGNQAFAIPIDDAVAVVDQIRAGKETATIHIGPRGYLGVATADGRGGATVEQVDPSSPASTAGLAVGDVVTSVDGKSADSASTVTQLVHAHRPGERVTVGWTAAGASRTATITLGMGAPD